MDPKLFVIGLLALPWTANEACAQASSPWTEPHGDFTVTIPEGWAEVANRDGSKERLLTIGSAAGRQSPDDVFRECIVEHRPMPDIPFSTQAEINAHGATATQQDIFRDRQLAYFGHEDRDGVLVTTAIAGARALEHAFALRARDERRSDSVLIGLRRHGRRRARRGHGGHEAVCRIGDVQSLIGMRYVAAGAARGRLRRRGLGAAAVSGFNFTRKRRPSICSISNAPDLRTRSLSLATP